MRREETLHEAPLVQRMTRMRLPLAEVCHPVGIREIRCRLRLREIYLCQHGPEYLFNS